MSLARSASSEALGALLEGFSLEMTGKDVDKLREARSSIPAATRINVTYLANEELRLRLSAARTARQYGFIPVPHVSARRLASRAQLTEFLAALQADGTSENVFVVGGDASVPEGPYEDSLAVIQSGLLQRYGVEHVGVSGYPEGHPEITDATLWGAIAAKSAVLEEQGLSGDIITQFGFDVDAVLTYVGAVRARGIDLPIRVGVPGPAGVRRLLGYAKRFGASTSASIAKKYGLSITNLMSTAGPDKFVRALADNYDPGHHGELRLHFYTFGALRATSEWVAEFREGALRCPLR